MSISDNSSDEWASGDRNDGIRRRHRHRRTRLNPMNEYNNEEFRDRYRVSKDIIIMLADRLQNQISPFHLRRTAMSVIEQILLTISFYATGAFQITVADNIRIHKSTACRIIKKVSAAIATLRPEYIIMPDQNQQNHTKAGFYNIAGFPNVIGALDCTHVKVQSPGGETAELWRNRKGYFSFNVQAVCDAKLKINDVICRWPGSVHDTTIFNDSHLRADFEAGLYGNSYLLGDGGYPCRSYLLTPFVRTTTPSQEAYNRAQILTRNPIERCFGVLKRRFPCLSMGLRVKTETAMNIIVSCCILHNIALESNDMYLSDIDELVTDFDQPEAQTVPAAASDENTSVRASLLQTHFNL